MKGARLLGFAASLCAIGVGVRISQARGQIGEQMMSIGEQMMRVEGAERQDTRRAYHINGQQIWVSSGTTDASVESVLDQFEERCQLLANEVQSVGDTDHLVLREGGGGAGAVGCLDLGGELSANELWARAERFTRTNNLGDLGDLRYVYARPLQNRPGAHFVTFWTEGDLDFDDFTGDFGNHDVPGTDSENFSRPPRSLRVLDVTEDGVPLHVRSYTGSTMSVWELEHFYTSELERTGYLITRVPATGDDSVVMNAERNGRMTTLILGMSAEGHGTATIIND